MLSPSSIEDPAPDWGREQRFMSKERLTITEIISIMEIMDSAVMSESLTASAALLEPTGIHTLDVRHAMDKLIAAVSPEQSHPNAAYGVVIYHADKRVPAPNMLSATGGFVQAYLKGWTALSKMEVGVVSAGEKGNALIGVLEHSNVRYIVKVFVGKAAVSALKKEAKPSPGVYINTAHLTRFCLIISGCLTFPSDSETCLSSC